MPKVADIFFSKLIFSLDLKNFSDVSPRSNSIFPMFLPRSKLKEPGSKLDLFCSKYLVDSMLKILLSDFSNFFSWKCPPKFEFYAISYQILVDIFRTEIYWSRKVTSLNFSDDYKVRLPASTWGFFRCFQDQI